MAIHILPWTVKITLDSKVDARLDMSLLNIISVTNSVKIEFIHQLLGVTRLSTFTNPIGILLKLKQPGIGCDINLLPLSRVHSDLP